MAASSRSVTFMADATAPIAGPSNTASPVYATAVAKAQPRMTGVSMYERRQKVLHAMNRGQRSVAELAGQHGGLSKRQRTGASAGQVFEGYPDCTNIGNTAISCYPADNTTIAQDTWSKFVWNPNWPDFVAATRVDVYLYNAGSEIIAKNWTSVENTQGQVPIQPNDDWWDTIPSAKTITSNQNLAHPYFFVIVPAGQSLSGGESHQATFSAIQTSPPSSRLASVTSASLASASASMFSASSLRAASSSSPAPAASSNASLQGDRSSNNSGFPKWAIALISILGAFLILAFILLLFIFRRRNREQRRWRTAERERTASQTPDMHKEPIIEAEAQRPEMKEAGLMCPPSSTRTESSEAMTAVRTRSRDRDGAESSSSSSGPFSAPEAAALADAFRQAMRKPDFHSELPEENSSPESATTPTGAVPSAILRESLKSETAASIRKVDDRKGYEVHPGED